MVVEYIALGTAWILSCCCRTVYRRTESQKKYTTTSLNKNNCPVIIIFDRLIINTMDYRKMFSVSLSRNSKRLSRSHLIMSHYVLFVSATYSVILIISKWVIIVLWPPGIYWPQSIAFCWCFVLLSFFSPPNLRGRSVDRLQTLPHVRRW